MSSANSDKQVTCLCLSSGVFCSCRWGGLCLLQRCPLSALVMLDHQAEAAVQLQLPRQTVPLSSVVAISTRFFYCLRGLLVQSLQNPLSETIFSFWSSTVVCVPGRHLGLNSG